MWGGEALDREDIMLWLTYGLDMDELVDAGNVEGERWKREASYCCEAEDKNGVVGDTCDRGKVDRADITW